MEAYKKHILILCSRLDFPAGIERAVVNAANLFSSKQNKVTVLIIDETDEIFYDLDDSVIVYKCNLNFGITPIGNKLSRKFLFLRDIQTLKKELNRRSPDIVIGTEYHLTIAALLSKNKKTKVYGWEHHHFHWLKKNWFWTKLFELVYPKLDVVVCNNETEKKLFESIGCKAVVIPYSIYKKDTRIADLKNKRILTVGWLNKRKGVDLIPAIAQKISEKHNDWKWKIIGRGEEFDRLNMLILEKNLASFIEIIPPTSPELANEYLNTSMLVMTSRFECLPMVLLEATSWGVPCIAFDCPTGPADIISDGVDGFLAPLEDVNTISNRIEDLIIDEEKRKHFGRKAYCNSKRFSPEKVYDLWEQLFNAE